MAAKTLPDLWGSFANLGGLINLRGLGKFILGFSLHSFPIIHVQHALRGGADENLAGIRGVKIEGADRQSI